MHRGLGQRDRLTVDLGVRPVAVQVQGTQVETGQFRNSPAAVRHQRGNSRGAQRGHRVGMNGAFDRQVVQQRLGVPRGQLEATGGRLAVQPGGITDELRESVHRVDPHPHRVRVRGRLRPPAGVPGPGPARGGVRQPGGGTLAVHQLPRGQRRGLSAAGLGPVILAAAVRAICELGVSRGPLRVPQILVEVRLADPAGRRGQATVGEVLDEGVDGLPGRSARVWGRHSASLLSGLDNSKK